jgi:hypothetical protein
VNLTHHLAGKLEVFERDILHCLKTEKVIHTDETGVSAEGKTNWLHVTCTPDLTYYSLQKKRGREAIDDIGVLPDYKGISVHDFWNPYLAYSCDHSFCCAHIIRELTRVEEETSQKWATELIELLIEAKNAKEVYHNEGVPIPEVILTSIKTTYDEIIQAGLSDNPPPLEYPKKRGRIKNSFACNLLERLVTWKDGVLKFIDRPNVPFDNNLAERDIRMMKVKMKISGGFRDYTTGRAIALIRSYISTIRKNQVNVIEGVVEAFENAPWLPEIRINPHSFLLIRHLLD